jgi:hypothetical protein
VGDNHTKLLEVMGGSALRFTSIHSVAQRAVVHPQIRNKLILLRFAKSTFSHTSQMTFLSYLKQLPRKFLAIKKTAPV